jgi:hypothetical protein
MLKTAISRNLDFCAKDFFCKQIQVMRRPPVGVARRLVIKALCYLRLLSDNWRERHSLLMQKCEI